MTPTQRAGDGTDTRGPTTRLPDGVTGLAAPGVTNYKTGTIDASALAGG
jgi:hypothetical protein